MNVKQCKNCQHFMQHLALNNRRLFRVYCGHCTRDRPKHKKPDAKACANFVHGFPQEDAFASKEYLSKELLNYMLSLDLLPKIEDEG